MSENYIVQFTGVNQLVIAGLGHDLESRAILRLRYREYKELYIELGAALLRLFRFSNASVLPWGEEGNHTVELNGKKALLITSLRYSVEDMKADISRGITGFFFLQIPLVTLPQRAIKSVAEEKGFSFFQQPLPREVYRPAYSQKSILPEIPDSSLSNAAFLTKDGPNKENLLQNKQIKDFGNHIFSIGKLIARQIECALLHGLISGLTLS